MSIPMDRRALTILLIAAVIVVVSVLFEWPGWLRLPLVSAWLLFVPGWLWARRIARFDAGDRIAVGIALSTTMLTIVGAAMALTGAWSPLIALLVLTAVGLAGAVVPVRRDVREQPADAGHAACSEGARHEE